MTSSAEATTQGDAATGTREPLGSRLRRAVPLLIGAIAVLVLVQPVGPLIQGPWIPILTGVAYVAAGLLSGRQGALLGPGIVLAAWGLAPATVDYAGTQFPGMFLLTLGAGLLIVALLAEKGWSRITPMSLALPVLFIGGTMAIAPLVDEYLTTVLAVLLAGWAAWEMRPQPDHAEVSARSTA